MTYTRSVKAQSARLKGKEEPASLYETWLETLKKTRESGLRSPLAKK
jgi:hypothetical protein